MSKLTVVFVIFAVAQGLNGRPESYDDYQQEKSAKYWYYDGQLTLRNHLLRQLNNNVAKNIIFFLGDGMSIPTLAAARAYLGQKQGIHGEESKLSFEDFPYVGLSKVSRMTVVKKCFVPVGGCDFELNARCGHRLWLSNVRL